MQHTWTIIAVVGLVAAGGLAYAVVFEDFLSPGGMRSRHGVQDHDRRLTHEARGFRPVVDALAAYHQAHHAWPATLAELPAPADPAYSYERHADGAGYRLTRRLGWDPLLTWDFDGRSGTWRYDPGDGGPVATVRLAP